MNELPTGYSFFKSRGGLAGIKDETGAILLYGLTEEICLRALSCHERFGGRITSEIVKEDYVEL